MTETEGSTGDSPKAHYGKVEDPRMSAEEMDERRKQNLAYEYLCHLEEAKIWIEACINEKLPPTTELEEGLRNGVYLAKLAHFMAPEVVPLKKIYDRDQARFQGRGLHFRHTDNTVHWLRALGEIGFPKIFYPETTDIYDKKNMPRVMYCIHALSLYLFKLGRAPQIQDLYGKIKFTDEEISAMRQELEKYGIQMPAFSKIGGILANEMPVDEAALHAAIIAINDAIDQQEPEATVAALRNPAAHLDNIYPDLVDSYQDVLYDAKETKAEVARNKSLDPDSSYIPDVYDELLTQAELQGNLNKINAQYALGLVNEALDSADAQELVKILAMPHLKLKDVREDNASFYLMRLSEARDMKKNNNTDEETILNRDEIQMSIKAANLDADKDYQRDLAIHTINQAIEQGDADQLLSALQNPASQLPPVADFAGSLYKEELEGMRQEKQADLDYDELEAGLTVLTAVAYLNKAVDTGNSDITWTSLKNENLHITSLDSQCQEKYHKHLAHSKAAKNGSTSEILTHGEIQQSIDDVNQTFIEESDRIEAVGLINEAIDLGIPAATLEALKLPAAKLDGVEDKQKLHYQNQLARLKIHKAKEQNEETADLWYEEVQKAVELCNNQAVEGQKVSVCLAAANQAIVSKEQDLLMENLENPDSGFKNVIPECADTYLTTLIDCQQDKASTGEGGSGWMMNRLQDGHKFYYNINTLDYDWERPDGVRKDHSLLTKEEMQAVISKLSADHDRQLLFIANESYIIGLQARIRGYLVRKKYKERLDFLSEQLPAIVKLQSWWRMFKAHQKYRDRLGHLHSNEESAVKIQSLYKMFKQRKEYKNRLQHFQDNENAVIKIQAYMRSNWAKQDYNALMHGENPPVSVVRKFVHLLDLGDVDYAEEIEVQKLRQAVVSAIRNNQNLEDDLNKMDIKIGLLVKNRITLQDVISQHKTLKQYRENSSGALNMGLKGLSKASRERLEAYQHLFYLLQTHPSYLAKLIFEMPQSRSTQFMESVILTLYNYASNQREEYLLLKLFKTALKQEIRSKVDKMSDITTGNPMVLKMIISFNRNTRGQGSLRDLLNPLVTDVLEDSDLGINTNPIEVYKQWINQTETDTGKASGLPYEVTAEQALSHPEVKTKIQTSIDNLQKATEKFLGAILENNNKIPYGMRYMAKVMKESLHERFPDALEKDVLKIVGNLIYYRFINSSIVAPDAFDIIDVGASKGLTNDQRRNLGSIAKILQFAAANKGFGGDSSHLSCLNPYISEAHQRFKRYFSAVCEVEEPESFFNMDQYSDLTRVTKPIIYISVSEILETHKLLLEHQDAIAEDHSDPLHELLEDLGDVPEPGEIVGEGEEATPANQAKHAATEVSLTLSNKFDVPDDDTDTKSMFIRTKRLVVDVIRCQRRGDNLVQILSIPATDEEEDAHSALILKREKVDQRAGNRSKLVRQQSLVGDTRLPLEKMKIKIQEYLDQLEKASVTSRKDNYQSVINSIVQDIRNQRLYRQRRRQEMNRLKQTQKSLEAKKAFFSEQVDYYNQYVKTCLDNLSTKAKKSGWRVSLFSKDSGPKAKGSIKYSAAKLYEKGVILEIEGLPTNQFKNVLFEISATELPGMFDVNAKFMGVSMEKVELIFQDLLQLQYEGVAVMKMFDKARINVNLLIFLLNKKFYGK